MSTIARARQTTTTRRRRLRIGPGSAGLLIAPQEFDALQSWQFARGNRYERINGFLVVSPARGIGERNPSDYLSNLHDVSTETHSNGSAIDETVAEQTIATTTNRWRADREIWAGLGRMPDPKADVLSIVSMRRRDVLRDYEVKRDPNLAARVLAYWVIDRFRHMMTVYRRESGEVRTVIIPEGQTYRPDLLPGFELPLSKLFEKSDKWKRPMRTRKPTPPAGGIDG